MDPVTGGALSNTEWGVILSVTVSVMSAAVIWLARYSWKMHREAIEQGNQRVTDLTAVHDRSVATQIASMAVVKETTAAITQLCSEIKELQVDAKAAKDKALEVKTVLDNRPCLRKEPPKS